MAFEKSYFERQYRDYRRQNPPGKLEFYGRLARFAAAGTVSPKILDIGCATGLFLSRLDSTWQKYGLDASEYAISRAREIVPQATLRVVREPGIPFEEKFDVITAFDVLEHLEDLNATWEAIFRSLRPGGGLVFVVPVYDGLTGPAVRLLDRDPTHLHKCSRDFWLQLPERWFLLREWWGIFRYLLPLGPYLHFVTRRFRRVSPAIACVFQRLALNERTE